MTSSVRTEKERENDAGLAREKVLAPRGDHPDKKKKKKPTLECVTLKEVKHEIIKLSFQRESFNSLTYFFSQSILV